MENVGENVGKNVGENPFKPNNTQTKIISLVKLDRHVTQEELSKQLNKSVRTIERNMKTLQEAKMIARIGSNTTGYWEVLK
jgi:ATP-dependent DNA helicase RecG